MTETTNHTITYIFKCNINETILNSIPINSIIIAKLVADFQDTKQYSVCLNTRMSVIAGGNTVVLTILVYIQY